MLDKKAITDRAQYESRVPAPNIDDDSERALWVWNEMGGEIDYAALPWLVERHGITDVDALLERLIAIRSTLREK